LSHESTIKKTKEMKTLKTIGYLLTALIAGQSNILNAGNSNPVVKSPTSESICLIYCSLAPTTPKEADFNENPSEIEITGFDFLKPLAPREANFDETDENGLNNTLDYLIEILAPVMPGEADFNPNEIFEPDFIKNLKPVIPLIADFDDK
jgi:hypothetical protein